MKNDDVLEKIFENLSCWRHLPKYQLERRADIFFTPYLKDIIESKISGSLLSDAIIPEFPQKKKENSSSTNIDYLMFSKEKDIVYLIELKTDNDSFDKAQYRRMKKAKKVINENGFGVMLENIIDIYKAGKYSNKYFNLLSLLATLGFIEKERLKAVYDIAKESNRQGNRRGIGKEVDKLTPKSDIKKSCIVYIVPNKDSYQKLSTIDQKDTVFITFHDAAKAIEGKSAFAKRLAINLEKWATEQPGKLLAF